MTDSFLKPYWLVVQTLSPIHIGSGAKLGKPDFILQNGLVHAIDENKLLNWIIRQPNAEQLALVLSDDLRRMDGGVGKFLTERFRGDLAQVIAYSVPYQGAPKDISAFIKTIDQQPYVPGSSMKGVLRSGLLRGKMLGDAELRQKAAKAIDQGAVYGRPKTNSDQIQANLFVHENEKPGKWPNFDINRLLIVRDSGSFSPDALETLAVKTLSIQFDKSLKPKSFDIFVEAVKAKQTIRHAVTWQENLLRAQAKLLGFQHLEDLMIFLPEYCRRVSQNLLTQEQQFYSRHGRKDLAQWFEKRLSMLAKSDEDVFILPMGWGSGYDAKTITDLLGNVTFEKVVNTHKNTWGLGKPGRLKEAAWMGPNDSPKSRKIIERVGGSEPMGWVACRFVADSAGDWLAERREILKERQPIVIIADPAAAQLPQQEISKPPATVVSAEKLFIKEFSAVPKPGDYFAGTVFLVEKGQIELAIPGLDADDQAYAVIASKDWPFSWTPNDGREVKCQVVSVEKIRDDYWRVWCKGI